MCYTGKCFLEPQDSPANFQLTAVNDTYAEFTWEPVDTSPDRIRGFFRGYRVSGFKSLFIHSFIHSFGRLTKRLFKRLLLRGDPSPVTDKEERLQRDVKVGRVYALHVICLLTSGLNSS